MIELRIISPESNQFFSVAWLEAHTTRGSFVIQQGHAPVILMLAANEAVTFMLKSGKKQSIPIGRGIMEVTRTSITIIMHKVE
jgi:F0F1-type ATP synthase epsilon subunit